MVNLLIFERLFDTNVRMESGSHAKVDQDTRQKILTVAERLFAEKGFHGVSVREITTLAGVHLSAVNYHFGSKENLYLVVFRDRFLERARRIRKDFRKRLQKAPSAAEAVIRALSEAVLFGPMSDEERVIHYQLLVREITEPTKAFEIISEQAVKPLVEEVTKALKLHFPKVSEEKLLLAVLSLFAQVLYFNFARPKIKALSGREYDEAFKRALVEHIVRFSLTGLEGLA